MAKDVDLSSREWLDVVFEGKNQDFGAYEMRKNSTGRHNRAVLVLIIVLVAVALLAFFVNTVMNKAEERPEDYTEQALVEMPVDEAEDEEPEEEENQRVEQPLPEINKEDLLNTVKMAEIAIVKDEEVIEEIKSQDDLKETDTDRKSVV